MLHHRQADAAGSTVCTAGSVSLDKHSVSAPVDDGLVLVSGDWWAAVENF
jgi:hypothetical protein